MMASTDVGLLFRLDLSEPIGRELDDKLHAARPRVPPPNDDSAHLGQLMVDALRVGVPGPGFRLNRFQWKSAQFDECMFGTNYLDHIAQHRKKECLPLPERGDD